MKIFLATWLFEETQGEALTDCKAKNRLISFHFLKKQKVTKPELKKYCKIGIHRIKRIS